MPPLLHQSGLWCSGDLSARGPPTSHLLAKQNSYDDYASWEPASPRIHVYLPASPRPSTPRGTPRSPALRSPSSTSPQLPGPADAAGGKQPAVHPPHARPRSGVGSGSAGPSAASPQSPRRASILSQARALQARHTAGSGSGGAAAAGPAAAAAAAAGAPAQEAPLLLVRSLHRGQQQQQHTFSSPLPSPAAVCVAAVGPGRVTPRRPASAAAAVAASRAPSGKRGAVSWAVGGCGAGASAAAGRALLSSSVPGSPAGSFTAGAGAGARLPAACLALGAAPGAGAEAEAGLRFGPPAAGTSVGGGGGGRQAWSAVGEGSEWGGRAAGAAWHGAGHADECSEGPDPKGAFDGCSGGSNVAYPEGPTGAAETCFLTGLALGLGLGATHGPPDAAFAAAGRHPASFTAGHSAANPHASCQPQPDLHHTYHQQEQQQWQQQQHMQHAPEGLHSPFFSPAAGGAGISWATRTPRSGGAGGSAFSSPRGMSRSLSAAAGGGGAGRPASAAQCGRASCALAWAGGGGGGAHARAGATARPASAVPLGSPRPASAVPLGSPRRSTATGSGSVCGNSAAGTGTGTGGGGGGGGGAVAPLSGLPFEVVPDSAAARRASLLESLAGSNGGRGCGRVGRALVGMLPPPHPAALAVPLEERIGQVLGEAGSRSPPAPAASPAITPRFIRMLTERRDSEAAAAAVGSAFSSPDPSAWMNQILAERAAALAAAAAAAAPGPGSGWAGGAQEPPGSAPDSPRAPHSPAQQARQPRDSGLGDGSASDDGSSWVSVPSTSTAPSSLPASAAAAAATSPAPPAPAPAPVAAPAPVVARHTSAEALHQHSLSYLASRDACRELAAASAPPPGAISLRDTAQWLGVGGGAIIGAGPGGAGATRPASAGRLFTRGLH